MEYKNLSPKALKLMRLTCAIHMLIFLVIGIVAGVLLSNVSIAAAIAVPVAVLLLCIVWFIVTPKIRFRRHKYLIAEDRIEIIKGLIMVSRTIIPIDRIHQIDIESGPLDRLMGLESVSVITAGSLSKFAFLEPEEAEKIAMYLNELIAAKLANKNTGENNDV